VLLLALITLLSLVQVAAAHMMALVMAVWVQVVLVAYDAQ
jgi:hypothetical protein